MSLYFDKTEVRINNSGLYAESASIDSNNNLTPVYTLGRKGTWNQTPDGPVRHNVSIKYFPKTSEDPNFNLINKFKNQSDDNDIQPVDVVIGNISGEGYITDLSMRSNPNQLVTADVSYVVYNFLSGNLEPKKGTNSAIDNSLAHSWTTYIRYTGDFHEVNTYGFEYSIDFNWIPVYTLGNKTPKQVNLSQIEENFTIVRDDYRNIEFSGENVGDSLFDDTRDNIKIIDASLVCDAESNNDFLTGTINNSIVLDISGAEVTNSNLNAGVGTITQNTLTIRKTI